MDVVGSLLPYVQPLGILGTLGTGLKRHELGSRHTWNRRGTLVTDRWRRRSAQNQRRGLPRVIKIFAKRSAPDHTMFLAGQKMVPTAAAARKMVIRFGHVSLSSPFFSALLRGFCGAWRRRSGGNPKSESRS